MFLRISFEVRSTVDLVLYYNHLTNKYKKNPRFLVKILCLLTFVMSVAHEKYLASINNKVVKRKKKPNESTSKTLKLPTEKERSDVIALIVNRLKLELGTVDAALGM